MSGDQLVPELFHIPAPGEMEWGLFEEVQVRPQPPPPPPHGQSQLQIEWMHQIMDHNQIEQIISILPPGSGDGDTGERHQEDELIAGERLQLGNYNGIGVGRWVMVLAQVTQELINLINEYFFNAGNNPVV